MKSVSMLANGDHSSEPHRLPFSMSFQNRLVAGTTIFIEGDTPENASSFTVNLGAPVMCCFYSLTDKDIAFSLSPHFDQRYIVRNSTKKKKWRSEEIASSTQFPLRRGSNFCIEIFVAGEEFLVALNRVHYCSFRPKIALSSVNSLEIDGDVRLTSVSVRTNEKVYPELSTNEENNLPECSSFVNCSSSPSSQNLMKVPLICRLPRTLQNGDVIKIEGRVKLLPYRFLMNIRSGEVRWPTPNILLHINGRYSYSQKNNVKDVFVFNSWSEGQWGAEKRATNVSLPMPGSTFKISITCSEDSFEITSDESLKVTFPNRMSLKDGKAIYVQGDVYIYSVSLDNESFA